MDACVAIAEMRRQALELTLLPAVKNSEPVVIAAKVGRADPIVWAKDTIYIVVVGGRPVIVARGISGDRKKNRIVPPRAPVGETVAPCGDAVSERQRIKAEPAVRIANQSRITLPPAVRDPDAARTEALDVSAKMSAACVPDIGVRFVVCWRGSGRRQGAGHDHQENPFLAASTHFSSSLLAVRIG